MSEHSGTWSTRIFNFMLDKAQQSLDQRWLGDNGKRGFDLLRGKWGEVPLDSQYRARSGALGKLDDATLLAVWTRALSEQSAGHNWNVRGWFYELYKNQFAGKRILEIGSGLGFDAITFALAGAQVTCADIAEENLAIIRRVARLRGLQDIPTVTINDLDFAAQLETFDVIWCCGSMINAPFEFTRRECASLLPHLPIGGRWIELGYPEARWIRDGRPSFEDWGEMTDGGAPWIEWKDLNKLQNLLAPAQFQTVLHMNFHNDDFNWFDLLRVS